MKGGDVAVSHYDNIEPITLKEGLCLGAKRLDDGGVGVLFVQVMTDPSGEAEAEVGRQERLIEADGHRMAKQGAQPGIEAVGRGQGVAVRKMKAASVVRDLDGLGREVNAKFF